MEILWLEDIEDQNEDFKNALFKKGYVPQILDKLPDFVDYLIDLKEKDLLDNICLILDIMMLNADYVTSPKEWNGVEDRHYRTLDRGRDAGLVFYEKLILQDACGVMKATDIKIKKFLNKPIPVIFLTTIPDDESNRTFANLKNRWILIKTKVKNSYWVFKFDDDRKTKFSKAIDEIEKSLEVDNGKAVNK